jgi:hypothetical protein
MMVTIDIDEYEKLKEDRDMLCALREAGVENWEGFSHACWMRKDVRSEIETDYKIN